MENPYARAAVPNPATPEAQRIADYEVAIGKNTGYYLKKFQEFDAGESKASWNWPAFFVTSCWFLYRKMWLPGLANLAYPFLLSFVLLIVGGIANEWVREHLALSGIICLVLFAAPWFLFPVFANAIYWRHVNNLIDRLPASVAQVPEKRYARLERNGGTGAGAMIAVILGGGFFLVFILGILAAIAIPAYQDYTIRAQVAEGFTLAAPVKAQVAEHWATHQVWPEQVDLGDDMPSGRYVQSVSVASGTVMITYGNAANPKLQSQRVALLPGVDDEGNVVWACGNASLPEGVVPGEGPYGSDLADRYLPAACRENGAGNH